MELSVAQISHRNRAAGVTLAAVVAAGLTVGALALSGSLTASSTHSGARPAVKAPAGGQPTGSFGCQDVIFLDGTTCGPDSPYQETGRAPAEDDPIRPGLAP